MLCYYSIDTCLWRDRRPQTYINPPDCVCICEKPVIKFSQKVPFKQKTYFYMDWRYLATALIDNIDSCNI